MTLREPLSNADATKLARKIIEPGSEGLFVTSTHARKELAKDRLDVGDALNVLRIGRVIEPAEEEMGTWRYRFQTARMVVVVAFRSEMEMVIVTAWRKNR